MIGRSLSMTAVDRVSGVVGLWVPAMIRFPVLFACSVAVFAQSPGSIQTIVRTGPAAFSGDGGPADQATLNIAVDVSADPFGNLFIADQYNHRIRMVAPDGSISTVA